MPQMRGETEQQWVARLRRYRETQMDRTRAAVCFLNSGSGHNGSGSKMAAFLDIFHPELSEEKTRELINDARERDRRRA